jgi:hypothetical protein
MAPARRPKGDQIGFLTDDLVRGLFGLMFALCRRQSSAPGNEIPAASWSEPRTHSSEETTDDGQFEHTWLSAQHRYHANALSGEKSF